jgi:hypothetical protein
VDEPDLWEALRERGIAADDAEIRASVRATLDLVHDVRGRHGHHHARRCAEAMSAALAYALQHPDTSDMTSFEEEFDDPE